MIYELKISSENSEKILKEIEKIEKEIFKNSFYSYETLKEMLLNENLYKIFYYESENKIVAYMIISDNIDFFEILKIAVLEKNRKQKIATKLIEKCNKETFLEVRENNFPAISFYKKRNFKIINLRKNYYQDDNENAIIMKLEVKNEQ